MKIRCCVVRWFFAARVIALLGLCRLVSSILFCCSAVTLLYFSVLWRLLLLFIVVCVDRW